MTVLNTRDPEVVTKTVTDSQVETTQLMRPQQGIFAGNGHGGVLVGLMDEVAMRGGTAARSPKRTQRVPGNRYQTQRGVIPQRSA